MNEFGQVFEKSIGYVIPFFIMKPMGFLYIPLIYVAQFICGFIISKIKTFFQKNEYTINIYEYNQRYSINETYIYISYFLQMIECDVKIFNYVSDASIKEVDGQRSGRHNSKSKIKVNPALSMDQNQLITVNLAPYCKDRHIQDVGKVKDGHRQDVGKVNKIPKNSNKKKYTSNPIVKISSNIKTETHGIYTTTNNYYQIIALSKETMDLFFKIVEIKAKDYYKKTMMDQKNYYYNYSTKNKWDKYEINSTKTFDNIFLDKNTKNSLDEYIGKMLNNDIIYSKLGIPQKLGLLFYGKPGTGKTSTIYAIASKTKSDIYNLNLRGLKSEFMEQVRLVPSHSVVCINDIDTIAISHNRSPDDDIYSDDTIEEDNSNKSDNIKKDKSIKNDNKKEDNSNKSNNKSDNKSNNKKEDSSSIIEKVGLNDLLEVLDGYCYFKKCIIIMTTNHIEKLDPALIRPGRIDHKFEFNLASHYQINSIMKYCYGHELDEYQLGKIPEYTISTSEFLTH